jgi:hypothetical protein
MDNSGSAKPTRHPPQTLSFVKISISGIIFNYHKDGMENTLFERFPANIIRGTFAMPGQIRPVLYKNRINELNKP